MNSFDMLSPTSADSRLSKEEIMEIYVMVAKRLFRKPAARDLPITAE